jgi:uncharacterized membrane protein YdbT with pleckstrin-like domain
VEPEPGEQVFFHGHPSWRSILGFYVKGLLAAVAAGAVAGVITAIASGKVKVVLVVVVVLVVFVLALLGGLIKRIQTTYTITNQRLTINTGILSKELHETRLARVQNVNSSQSLLERILRVGTVAFDTAGEAGYDFSFRGVSDPNQIVRTVDRAIREFQELERSGV